MQDLSTPYTSGSDEFKVLANISHGAIYDWNVIDNEIWWNNRYSELFGYHNTKKASNLNHWLEKLHPDEVGRVRESLESALRNGDAVWENAYRFKKLDGVYAHVHDRASIIRNDKGEPQRVIGSMLDITSSPGLIQAEAEWEERMQLALDASELGTWVLDPTMKIINWDARCKEFFGFSSRDNIQYDDLLAHIHPEDRSRVNEAVQLSLTQRRGYNIEFRTIAADSDRLRWLRCKGKAYFNSSGIAYRFAGTAQDITEEKRKDQVLADIEKKYQSAFDNASQGIVMLNPDGRFLLVNKAFVEITGYPSEELYADNFADITHPEDVDENRRILGAMKAGELSSCNFTKRYLRKDGSIIWVNVHTTLTRTSDGKAEAFLSIVQDISDQVTGKIQQQKLLTLVENSVELMSILELDGKNSYLNKAGMEMLGFDSMEQVLQTPIADLHRPEDLKFVEENVLPSIMGTGRWAGSMLVKHLKTGEVFPVFNSSLRIDDPLTGKPLAVGAIMRDLRPEMAARQALIESEHRFRNMILNAPAAIALLRGEDLVVETANPAMLELWGKTAEIIGLPLLNALPELEGQPFRDLLLNVLHTAKDFAASEYRALLSRNGKMEECYFNFLYSPVWETNERVNGVMIVAFEVTEQVRAKKALEDSERRFRDLVMNAPMPIGVYVGPELVIQLANEEVLRTWDKDESVIGKTFREALPELEGQGFFELLEEVYRTGISYQATEDKVDLFVDGRMQTYYFNFTYKALKDGDGKVYGVINTATDVTELVKARQNLKKTEEQLRIAIESAEMGTWTVDFATGMIKISERILNLTGLGEEQAPAESLLQLIAEDDRERIVHNFQQVLNSGNEEAVYRDECWLVNKVDNRKINVRCAGKIFFRANGQPLLAIGTVQDITVQKMTQQQLEAEVEMRTEELRTLNASLLRSNQDLEQFAYVASHDLQEPLRKIRMFSDLLEKYGEESNGGYLQKIRASAERMSSLIKDLLDFSRISEKEELYEPVNLQRVAENVSHDFELLIRQKNAIIQVDQLPTIEAIPLMMNQLFYNLVGNALKFTSDNRTPVIHISSRVASDDDIQTLLLNKAADVRYHLIRISDNGIGFPSYLSEKIFTIFQRLNGSAYEGTGIGLALCKKIVIGHGGYIRAESDGREGASFEILLPELQSQLRP